MRFKIGDEVIVKNDIDEQFKDYWNQKCKIYKIERKEIYVRFNKLINNSTAYLFYENYPLSRTIYVILNDPRGSLPSGITNFMTSDRGQRIILKAGLVPATQPIRVVNIKDEQ